MVRKDILGWEETYGEEGYLGVGGNLWRGRISWDGRKPMVRKDILGWEDTYGEEGYLGVGGNLW